MDVFIPSTLPRLMVKLGAWIKLTVVTHQKKKKNWQTGQKDFLYPNTNIKNKRNVTKIRGLQNDCIYSDFKEH